MPEASAAKTADFLFDKIRERLAKEPAILDIVVQLVGEGDAVDDSTVHWPEDRTEVAFGTVLMAVVPNNDAEQRHIIFDPIPRVEGLDPSGDPLLDPRANVYLMSGRRRRQSSTPS